MGLVGNVLSPSSFNFVSSVAWSQSNRQISSGEKYWAGISIVGYGGVFYVFGQSTNSNQNLLYTYTNTTFYSVKLGAAAGGDKQSQPGRALDAIRDCVRGAVCCVPR